MSKSPDAFRTISEVAEWLGIPAHVLRFWESKFTQIKPVKRAGGRRYYRPADMMLLGGIKRLLHDDGLSIKEVQALLRDQGAAHVSDFSASLEDDINPSTTNQSTVFETQSTVVKLTAATSQSATPQPGVTELKAEPAPGPSAPPPAPQLAPTAELDSAQPEVVQDDPVAAPEPIRPNVVEIEDTADDALRISHAGVLARLATITALSDSSAQKALICAEQLRAISGRENNLATN